MTEPQRRFVLIGLVVTGALFYVLGPVLTPFLVSAFLAYLGDPAADWLERHRFSRTASVITVFLVILLIILPLPLWLVPLLEHQIVVLLQKVPVFFAFLKQDVLPRLQEHFGVAPETIDLAAIQQSILGHWQQMGGVAANLVSYISRSGMLLIALITNALLVPVVTFYLLRDWDILIARLRELLPRAVENRAVQLVRECDVVLAAFFRGQLLVMVCLAVIYTVGLSIAGLDLALLIGFISGMVAFVPYLGFIVGASSASVAAFLQFHDVIHLVYVLAAFGVGQLIESFLLTPILLGDRIGLHPVVVIFALMVGGELFGFFGVLLALPVAAVAVVLLRHAHQRYLKSHVYGRLEQGGSP